jgi:hypothetical protein
MTSFRLAPMTPGLRAATWLLFLLPLVLLGGALGAPPAARSTLMGATVLSVVLYALVWLAGRPRRFEVDAEALRIRWPVRARRVARSAIQSARLVSADDFRREYGSGIRIGAGGIWGGFGLLQTPRETFSMWISRTDNFVLLRLTGARPLLITPEHPEQFLAALGVN